MKLILKLFNFFFLFILLFTFKVFAKEIIINGNEFSDNEVVSSIIGNIPEQDDETNSNYILKKLNNSGLFQNVEIKYDENYFYVDVIENPSINKIFYVDNERVKDEEIDNLVEQLGIYTLSDKNISNLVDELTKIYQSFGYNNIVINTNSEIYENNSADLFLTFKEGKITKITRINFSGNDNIDKSIIMSKIKSKTKTIRNIFANNNFKIFQINNDTNRIAKFYKTQGYKDVTVSYNVEYFSNNKVEINFKIKEGKKYYFSSLKINNNLNEDENIISDFESLIEKTSIEGQHYNFEKIDDLEIEIADILELSGEQFFQINTYEKIVDNNADILFEISKTKVLYINQINVSGNTRTYDYVIRRELDVSEGDPINETKIKKIKRQLNQMPFFSNTELEQVSVDDDLDDLNINVEETQTGSFNVGLSLGSLDGVSFLSGLKERNINGTGRSLEFLINTSDTNRAFTLSTTEKFILNSKVNHKYSTNYNEKDFSKSKSYKLNTFNLDTSFQYDLSDNFYHTFGLGYSLKDYIITNNSTVESNILKSSGENINFNISSEIFLNTLNSFFRPTKGNYLSVLNFVETPSSSTNGFIKNVITAKKYLENNDNIYSIQAKAGNIHSISNNEILSDSKFSLGGRWLRGFDNFGAGPRNSRTSYVGGNNLLVSKLDFSRPITLNEQNPIYFNLFNDYGTVWGNKNTVSSSDRDLRISYGFGINYYSPIGPVGFSWGFPLVDKDYDIKRMFLFTIGNLN